MITCWYIAFMIYLKVKKKKKFVKKKFCLKIRKYGVPLYIFFFVFFFGVPKRYGIVVILNKVSFLNITT